MADALAVVRTANNTAKAASAIKGMWEARTNLRATTNDSRAFDSVIKAQIDEVFLVLAHLGEAILPLGVFNKDYYLHTLGEVQASIDSCGHDVLPAAWKELDPELQYVVTAGLAICAIFAPMHVYRGFGACVLGDWDWACPDIAYLQEKAHKKAIRTVYGVKQKVDAQPTRAVFAAFDQTIQILQVKSLTFLEKRPAISGFAEQQLRYGKRRQKEVEKDFDLLEDWIKQLERRGHPVPTGSRLTSFGFPFATWTSTYSCDILRTHKDCETIMLYQMDPGRLLHAFVVRGNATLDQGQILCLLPRSPAETILCWLEGLPGTSHKIITWQDLETEEFERKLSKSMRKKIGHHPIPTQFAIRDPNAPNRQSLATSSSSPSVLEHPNTVSPPPYKMNAISPTAEIPSIKTPPAAELGSPDARELPASPLPEQAHQDRKSASFPTPGLRPELSPSGSQSQSGLKTINTLRRKPTPQSATTTIASSGNANGTSSDSQEDTSNIALPELPPRPHSPAELPDSNHIAEMGAVQMDAVEMPTEFNTAASRDLDAPKADDAGNEAADDLVNKTDEVEQSNERDAIEEQPTASKEPNDVAKTEPLEDSTARANLHRETDAGTIASYLDLLRKVAKGDVSPEDVAQMFERGETGFESGL